MMHALYPTKTAFPPKDWEILAQQWHPVALVEEVTEEKPFGAILLDVPIVLYRIGGLLSAAHDLCPHRGTKLSLGYVRDGKLTCPYHGLEFDGAGQCVGVPAHGAAKGRPRYLDLQTVLAAERFGLVWICLLPEPSTAIPDWSIIEQPGNQRTILHDYWNASAGRHVENFCDLAHFSFIHAATFGLPDYTEVKPYDVERTNDGFRYIVDIPMLDGSVFDETKTGVVVSEYHVCLPFSTRLTMHYTRGIEHICDVASPISAERCRIFILKSRDHDQDEPLEAERHLSSDHFSVLFRRHWAERGLEGPL